MSLLFATSGLMAPTSVAAQAACESHAALSVGLAVAPALAGLGSAIASSVERAVDALDGPAAGEDSAPAPEQPSPARPDGGTGAAPPPGPPPVPLATVC